MLKKQNCVVCCCKFCFIVYIKTDDIYRDIAEDIETSNYELHSPIPKGKNTKVVGLMIND